MNLLDKLETYSFYLKHPALFNLRNKGFAHERYLSLTMPWIQNMLINTILDIGANTGQAALVFRKAFPDAQIYSFEPLPDCYQELQLNMKQFSKIKLFNLALGEQKDTVHFERNAYSPSSSMLAMTAKHRDNFPYTKESKTVTVEMERLDDLTSQIKLTDNILIKLDVQGFERQVIGGGNQVFSQAKILIVETSFDTLYEKQPLFDDIYLLLKKLNFRYEGSFEQLISPVDQRILQQDAIFIRQ